MEQTAKKRPHAVYNSNDHLVWVPRYRKKALLGPVRILLSEIALQCGFEIVAHEIMPDPVHMFVSAPPKFGPAEIVRLLNWIASRRLMQEFAILRRHYGGE